MLAFGLLAAAASCDIGTPEERVPRAPALVALSTYPRDAEGADCSPQSDDDCGVPVDVAIEVRFDRFVAPDTAVRQSVRLFTGSDQNQRFDLAPEYDLVERVVRYRLTGGPLEPRTLYTAELLTPEQPGAFGFRAFDGAPLEPGPVPLRFSFFTGAATDPLATPGAAPSCADIVRLFVGAGCAASACHDALEAPVGLRLGSVDDLRETVIARVARETETGPAAGVPLEDPARFGVNMPRVDPSRPSHSYLFYKLLLAPENFAPRDAAESACRSRFRVELPPGECPAPSADERLRLSEWFVLGDAMPPPGFASALPLGRDGLDALHRWIAEGARCP
ncbi:MAG TPA: hypothetical protein VF989_17110 [Polyangiaceae bacterium]